MEKQERYNYVFDQYDGDSFVYDLKEDKKIEDLSQCAYILNKYETELAENKIIIQGGKEEIKDLHRKINEIVERDMNCIQQLKQQLAEKDEEIKQLKFQIAVDEDWAITNRTRLTELEDELNEVESFMKNYGFDSLDELKEYYVNLLELKDWIKDRIDGTESDNGIYTEFNSGQCNAYYKVLDKLDKLYNPNQNQTAIAELQKVLEWLNIPFDENGCLKNGEDLENYINQQITELKGEK